MKMLVVVIAMSALFVAQYANASAWHYAGGMQDKKGRMIVLFYDSETIKYSSDSKVRFWIEGFLRQKINAYSAAHQKEFVDPAARRLLSGYKPEIYLARAGVVQEQKRQELCALINHTC